MKTAVCKACGQQRKAAARGLCARCYAALPDVKARARIAWRRHYRKAAKKRSADAMACKEKKRKVPMRRGVQLELPFPKSGKDDRQLELPFVSEDRWQKDFAFVGEEL